MTKPAEINYPFTYDYKKLWDLDIPTEEIPIDDLESNLGIAYLEKEGTDDWNLTLRELIEGPQSEPSHYKKIQEADIKYPIEIYFFNGEWRILDGVHRFCKAILSGDTTIKVRRVREENIQKEKGVFLN